MTCMADVGIFARYLTSLSLLGFMAYQSSIGANAAEQSQYCAK